MQNTTQTKTAQSVQQVTQGQNLSDKRTRCEVWTRVMGYHRPVSNFNVGKKSEFYSRKSFSEVCTSNSKFMKKYS